MREIDGKKLFSASDLGKFLACSHAIYMDLKNLEEPMEKSEDDEQAKLIQEKGIEHEESYLAKLKENDLSIAEIPSEGKLEEESAQTLQAMEDGVDMVYQATLIHKSWHGYADFLRKTEIPSKWGDFSYEVLDTKLARAAAPHHVLQLCVYTEMVGSVQGGYPNSMYLILGDGNEATFRFSDFEHYFRGAQKRFEDYVLSPPEESEPEPCHYCQYCAWRNHCEAKWEEDDHLQYVANIHRTQINKLKDSGITTLRALAESSPKLEVPKLGNEMLSRLRAQARLQVQKRDSGEDVYEILPVEEGKGFSRLPRPNAGDLFFDIEGDPLYPDGLEYLLGTFYHDRKKPKFSPIWAHDHEAERKGFEQWVDFVLAHLGKHPDAHIYHYAHYEETALKRLASRYGTREEQVDNLLRHKKLVDLFKVVRESLRVSEPRYSIKNLETFYMEKRGEDVQSAGESIVVYENWRKSGDGDLLQEISDYNEFDCRSTYMLREWLLKLRPEETPWFNSRDQAPSEERSQNHQEAEERRSDYEKKLIQTGSDDEHPVRELVYHLLEFHRREAKPQWWAMFHRQELTDEELIDDPECIGNMSADSKINPFPDKRSTVFPYRFPIQDFKMRVGSQCLWSKTLESVGEIVALDSDEGTISLKRGNTRGPLPSQLSIIPNGPIGQGVQREAIYRFADALIQKDRRYSAVKTLLRKDYPRVKGVLVRSRLIPENGKLLSASAEVISKMKESCMFIQGPPGAGKTFTSAHIITQLIRSGRKIGVTSNSHKAINNLLAAVETTAKKENLKFLGIKKATKGNEDSFFDGDMVENVTSNDAVALSADLIAGTSWLFSREEFDQSLDYLFIDEAGQVSLANVVAMGLSAKNIVLVGDQMQLGQPIQGVHPGKSGLSVLEYLLDGTATISPEKGIFLSTTWRMHEDVCRFISNAVYDGRLKPEIITKSQTIVLENKPDPDLLQTGIRFLPIIHEGCSQKSEEEGEVVARLYSNLLNQAYRDAKGKKHPVSPENILVVTPYNVQVNYLKSILPPGSRVGTVDKFQGQEAEVVLISMVTSSEEDLPRHVEFLYSKNRLNVAISRARSLSIVVASPRLLEIPCRTVDQMKLVNTLCWVREYSDQLTPGHHPID